MAKDLFLALILSLSFQQLVVGKHYQEEHGFVSTLKEFYDDTTDSLLAKRDEDVEVRIAPKFPTRKQDNYHGIRNKIINLVRYLSSQRKMDSLSKDEMREIIKILTKDNKLSEYKQQTSSFAALPKNCRNFVYKEICMNGFGCRKIKFYISGQSCVGALTRN